MALKATIFKAELGIADLDRGYYADHALTLARHPSETDERLMARLLAFAWHADAQLQFTRGLSSDDEPELWRLSLAGDVEQWIELGLPDERRLRKSCGRARQVIVYAYGGRGPSIWRQQTESQWQRFANLTVYLLPKPATDALAALAERNMRLQCTIQDEVCYLTDGATSVDIRRECWFGPDAH